MVVLSDKDAKVAFEHMVLVVANFRDHPGKPDQKDFYRGLIHNDWPLCLEEFMAMKDDEITELTVPVIDDMGKPINPPQEMKIHRSTANRALYLHRFCRDIVDGNDSEFPDLNIWLEVTKERFQSYICTQPISPVTPSPQPSSVKSSPLATSSTVTSSKKSIKRDVSKFSTLNDMKHFYKWCRSVVSQDHAQDVNESSTPSSFPPMQNKKNSSNLNRSSCPVCLTSTCSAMRGRRTPRCLTVKTMIRTMITTTTVTLMMGKSSYTPKTLQLTSLLTKVVVWTTVRMPSNMTGLVFQTPVSFPRTS